jgi:hypothetical protein
LTSSRFTRVLNWPTRAKKPDITDTGHGAFLDAFGDRHQRVRDSKKGAVRCTTDQGHIEPEQSQNGTEQLRTVRT